MCDVGAEEMPAEEEESDGEMGSENGEVSSKQKYRALKRRLKYLSYEHECFENDVQKAQTKLLQLARDKSFLLDQLTRYEAVVISDNDETDYSSVEEDVSTLAVSPQIPAEPLSSQDVGLKSVSQTVGKSSVVSQGPPNVSQGPPNVSQGPSNVAVGSQLQHTPKGSVTKSAASILSLPSTTASLGAGTTMTVSKATGVVKPATSKKTSKASGGGGGKKLSASVAARITKTVAKARGQAPALPVAQQPTSPLIVSFPLSIKASTHNATQQESTPEKQQVGQQEEPALPPPSTEALPTPAPLVLQPPLPSAGAGVLSSSSSSSGSSSSSDSDESGSQSSSSSSDDEEEPMDMGGPVPMVNKVGATPSSTPIIRPKAITSPVKVPPQLIQVIGGGGPGRSPILSPLTSPRLGGFSWSNRLQDASTASHGEVGGFVPIAPPLSSPPSTPPLGLGTPSPGSAFHKVSPKLYHAESSKQSSN